MTSNDRCAAAASSAPPLLHKFKLIESQCDAHEHNSDHLQSVTELERFFHLQQALLGNNFALGCLGLTQEKVTLAKNSSSSSLSIAVGKIHLLTLQI